jgi:hypothetical protein
MSEADDCLSRFVTSGTLQLINILEPILLRKCRTTVGALIIVERCELKQYPSGHASSRHISDRMHRDD